MKSFREHLTEQVLPTVQVADGGLDIDKPAVRAAINAAIAGVTSQPAVTPYVVFNRLSKLLAQYHIILPKKFLEGDKGVEVFEIRQFGHRMGMTDSGEFVNDVPSTHYLFLQYGIITPFGITYAKPVVGGMFRVMARLVDKAELDKLMDMAEISLAEEAEVNQAIAKANAPRDEMHDITSDEKKKGNKAAVAASQKGLDEDKDPCWKGYEMIGMKKKSGKPVPNCVPVKEEEEQIDELSNYTMSNYMLSATDKLRKLDKAKPEDKDWKSIGKREHGMHRAANKIITREKKLRKALGEEQIDETHADNIRRKYREKEDSNDHTGNVHLLTRTFGSKKEREASKQMLRKRDKQGYSSSSDSEKGYKITKKYASRLDKLKEATDKDRDLSKLAADAVSKGHPVKKVEPGRAEGSSLRKGMAKGYNIEKGRWSGHGKFGLGEEQIDELSRRTLGSYIKKAHVSGLAAADDAATAYQRRDYKELHKQNKTGEKREQGINRAADKLSRVDEAGMPSSVIKHKQKLAAMTPEEKAKKFAGKTKEQLQAMAHRHGYGKGSDEYSKHVKEEQIDELKKTTLASYIKKASHDVATRSAETRGGAMKSDAALEKNDYTGYRKHRQHSDKMFAKSWKRREGIAKAADKLAKEETLDEKAPPGAKYERMVKHIKKGYAKDGLTAKEKGIAFATAWKAKNREKGE